MNLSLRGAQRRSNLKKIASLSSFVRNDICLLFLIFFLTGCMQLKMLPHLDEVLTLQAMGKDGDAQEKIVKETARHFDALQEAVKSGAIKQYKTSADITNAFGLPIMAKAIEQDGKSLQQWLYRYALARTSPKKIYLFFDADHKLVSWDYVDPQADQPQHPS